MTITDHITALGLHLTSHGDIPSDGSSLKPDAFLPVILSHVLLSTASENHRSEYRYSLCEG